MEHKRELIYEMSKWPEGASEILQSWSRQEILQILCAELGKERKYTGLTKSKLIDNLLKLVSEKRSREPGTASVSEDSERTPKRQRKSDHPNHLPFAANGAVDAAPDIDSCNNMYCKNSACKAKLNHEDVFCKRCSCCICHQYDDNKDPSLWLVCNSDAPFRGPSCGMSCHLECALRHEKSGISQERQDKGLDGSFSCVSCGKVNDLLSSWRKQLVVAKETRRVDILCYRLSLSQKILAGAKHYQHLCNTIDEAVKKLEEEAGPLTGLPVKKARGIVNRLSSGTEIQRLCASALESLDFMLSNSVPDMPSGSLSLSPSPNLHCVDCNTLGVKFEDIRASSLMVVLNSDDIKMGNVDGYTLWHRKAEDADFSAEPTCRLFQSNVRFLLSGLTPATQYVLKVVAVDADREAGSGEFRFQTGSSQDEVVEASQSPVTNCSSLSDPSSVEDETYKGENGPETTTSSDQSQKTSCIAKPETALKESNKAPQMGSEAGLPVAPCKFENVKDDGGRSKKPRFGSERDAEPQAGSSSKKRSGERRKEKCELEYYVKVIRWLECEGHVEASFRRKFLTWYSLRATPQEVRIVKVFIDTFVEDPESLAGQLLDSFSDIVSDRRCSTARAGFCTKLWH